ncbi:aminoglycoside phosphotransferase family protein [Patescibacteria group bacterium]|nr:aminoglycoside phosphotransferase family protein [Patescibacteria group bacterium]MBU1256168.1 aminoglycoside phosphotransferase family protein [Patescibacteria group bacterium]MBU1457347.1 aminoglycoside phosphotransferase family protein [Patescibacteria group bacterium]
MDEALATTLISKHFPKISINKIKKIGEGTGNIAFEVNTDNIFRFPKGSENQKRLEREISIQAILKKYSPLPIPEFIFIPIDHSFVGYKKLPGNPLLNNYNQFEDWSSFSKQLGKFLSRLHTIPGRELAGVNLLRETRSFKDWLRHSQIYFEKTKSLIPQCHLQKIEMFFSSTFSDNLENPVLCHNDLGIEHILIIENKVTGIIDWGGTALTDPACDFARIYRDVGVKLLNKVLAEYSNTMINKEKLRRRAIFYGKCLVFEDLHFGKNQKEYLDKALAALTWMF